MANLSLDTNKKWTVTPNVSSAIILETGNKYLDRNIVVQPMSMGTKATCTVEGGGLTIDSNYTATPDLVLSSGNDTNMTNITAGAKSSTYPYYFKIDGNTGELIGSTKVTRASITDQHTAGYLAAKDATTVIASASVSPTVGINATSSNIYVGLKGAVASVTGSLSGGALNGSNYILSDTNTSNVTIGRDAVSGTIAANITAAGYAPVKNSIATLAPSSDALATKYIKGITLGKGYKFDISNTINNMTVEYRSDTNCLNFVFA